MFFMRPKGALNMDILKLTPHGGKTGVYSLYGEILFHAATAELIWLYF